MKRSVALCCLALTAPAASAQFLMQVNPFDAVSAPQRALPYRGATGTQYQYDLARPSDPLRYELDSRAQIRDTLSVDPRRDLDRSLGQRGAGIRK